MNNPQNAQDKDMQLRVSKISIKNLSGKNVEIELDVQERDKYGRILAYVYVDGMYYEEITDSEKLEELTTITISELSTKEPYIIQYEVRVNKGTANTEISNKTSIIYDGSNIQNIDFKNTINMKRMFSLAKIKIGYARTQDDANKLNSSEGKPNSLIFIVKQ